MQHALVTYYHKTRSGIVRWLASFALLIAICFPLAAQDLPNQQTPDPDAARAGTPYGNPDQRSIPVRPPANVPPPPPPPPPSGDEKMLFTVVQEMPTFHGCAGTYRERHDCTHPALFQYLTPKLRANPVLQKLENPGLVIISFVVAKDGSMHSVSVVRSPHSDEVNAALVHIFENFPVWTPGIQRGQPVAVKMTLPIRLNID